MTMESSAKISVVPDLHGSRLTAANDCEVFMKEKNVEVRCSIIVEIHLLQNDSDSDLMEVESFTSVQGTSTPSPSPSSFIYSLSYSSLFLSNPFVLFW
jgi:hypothetical protein